MIVIFILMFSSIARSLLLVLEKLRSSQRMQPEVVVKWGVMRRLGFRAVGVCSVLKWGDFKARPSVVLCSYVKWSLHRRCNVVRLQHRRESNRTFNGLRTGEDGRTEKLEELNNFFDLANWLYHWRRVREIILKNESPSGAKSSQTATHAFVC